MTKVQPMNVAELTRCRDVLLGHVQVAHGIDDPNQTVKDILAAFYEQRYGPAEGSTAYHAPSRRHAVRYYDDTFKELRWLVFDDAARDLLRAERVNELPGNEWRINARPWQELVYR